MPLPEQVAVHMPLVETGDCAYAPVGTSAVHMTPDGTGGCARPCCIGRSRLVSYKTRRKEDEMDDRVGHSRFGILLQKIIRGI